MQLDTGSAANTPLTPRFQQYGSSKVRGTTMNALRKSEKNTRVFRPAQCAERALTGILGTPSLQSRKVNVQRRNSRRDQFRVLIENADKQGRERETSIRTSMVFTR